MTTGFCPSVSSSTFLPLPSSVLYLLRSYRPHSLVSLEPWSTPGQVTFLVHLSISVPWVGALPRPTPSVTVEPGLNQSQGRPDFISPFPSEVDSLREGVTLTFVGVQRRTEEITKESCLTVKIDNSFYIKKITFLNLRIRKISKNK